MTRNDGPQRIVDLSAQVKVRTQLDATYIPALRSGFAGYPMNPRWNVAKLRAWRLGCQWRHDLATGSLALHDSLLVASSELPQDEAPLPASPSEPPPPSCLRQRLQHCFSISRFRLPTLHLSR